MRIEIRRQDGSVEDSVTLPDTAPATDIAKALHPLADLYVGTGYSAYLLVPGWGASLVGTFGSGS